MKTIYAKMACLLIGMSLLPLTTSVAMAAEKDDKQSRAVQRRLQQMQQVQQKLEQENTALKEQLKESEAKLAAAQTALSTQKQSISKLQALNSEQDSNVSACQGAQQAVRSELEVNEVQRKQLSADKAKLEIALSQQKTEVQACQEKNVSLINASLELMKKYEKEALSGVEPLTGLKGVEIENQFQTYRDQTESQYYRPGRAK